MLWGLEKIVEIVWIFLFSIDLHVQMCYNWSDADYGRKILAHPQQLVKKNFQVF